MTSFSTTVQTAFYLRSNAIKHQSNHLPHESMK